MAAKTWVFVPIANDFKYVDPNNTVWLTKKGDVTDGASIPVWARPFIGEPFDRNFIKAAVIHDHYCDRNVRPWRDTHRVFYDALITSKLNKIKAKLMYYAVYFGGPKWIELIPGIDCGPRCQYMRPLKMDMDGTVTRAQTAIEKSPPPELIVRSAQYDKPGFIDELKDVEKLLDEKGDAVSLTDLENRAKEKMPDDFFYNNNDSISMDKLILERSK